MTPTLTTTRGGSWLIEDAPAVSEIREPKEVPV